MLTIEESRVLEAAKKCPTAKTILETLFPELFKQESNEVNVWDLIQEGGRLAVLRKSSDYPGDYMIDPAYKVIVTKRNQITYLHFTKA